MADIGAERRPGDGGQADMIAGRTVARNAFLNFAGQGVPLVVGTITIPFTIRWLGPNRFGILALVWVLIGYLNVFDLGLGRATTKFVAAAMGRDEREIPSLVGTAGAAQLLLGVVGAVVLWLGAPTLVDRVLSLPPSVAEEARGAFTVLALSAPVVLVSTSVRGVLEAAQRFDLVNAVRVPMGTMHFVLPLLGAAAGWPLSRIVLSILMLQAAGMVGQYLLCLRVFPALRRPRVEVRAFKRLLAFGGWVAVSGLVGPILVYLDRFAIAALLSIAAVGYYAAPYEIVTRLSIIPVSLVVALFPVFSAFHDAPRHLETLAARSLRALLLAMGVVIVATVALASDIVTVWLGPEVAGIVTVPLQILAAGVLVNSLAYVPYSLLQAIGRPDVTGKIHLVELPIHFVLVWVLVDSFGLVGAALAWSIRCAVDAVLLFLAAARLGPLGYGSLRSSGVPALAAWVVVLGLAALAVSSVPSFPLRVGALIVTLAGATMAMIQPGWRDRLVGLPSGSSSPP